MGDEREALKGKMSDEREALSNRKRYHRHSQQQIQQMEAFYKECPHPDEKQRKELSIQLGIEPIQVKFWFQNKRTQMKTQHEHNENAQLRIENERLRAENLRFREALINISCPNCGVPNFQESQLMENYSLNQHASKPSSWAPHLAIGPINNEVESEDYRAAVMEAASSAMEELVRVAQLGEPLWVASADRHTFVLNEEEYFRAFPKVFGPRRDGFKSEASREAIVVPATAADVVGILMDVEQWTNVFSGVVSQATNLQVVSSGLEGTYNEVVQVMTAEFHVPSPVVPTRESYFVRHCRRHVDATWAVVDVSLDHLHSTPSNTCRRRPSGCLIQDMPNGYSKVIWVEHVEVEGGGVHSIYKPLITAGLAFGARRWIAILNGYCQRVVIGLVPSDIDFLENQQGRKSMLKLAERMVARFCRGVNTSIANIWTTISGFGNSSDCVKIMTRKNVDDLSMPLGFHLNVATSFWLPIPPKRVFDFLRDHNNRKEWDMLLNGGDVEEMAHIASGKEDGNRVTMYQVKAMGGSSSETIMLQESRKDPTASYVVYAPIDMICAETILGGGDPISVPLLPSGFAILPDGPTRGGRTTAEGETGGSLLTVALQVLVDSTPDANLNSGSLAVANKIICGIMDKIKQALIT
ncbi:homeobox-leucine zipper protein PROTODERMAL FACTOR 2-like [Salvia miltiorrhiza]|uniref:homeobox-leucine zipper protein PROTODERMAL FACTOR 2-like n=1 Tax=Salvia miltiorrhiza TaxID=226208 RepID=UPI0025ABE337|nr:homeobox-leucine zipper protein PROTODERMAL FACTOR 2-like [Salvia miltiorrhiza]